MSQGSRKSRLCWNLSTAAVCAQRNIKKEAGRHKKTGSLAAACFLIAVIAMYILRIKIIAQNRCKVNVYGRLAA